MQYIEKTYNITRHLLLSSLEGINRKTKGKSHCYILMVKISYYMLENNYAYFLTFS